MSDDEKDLPEFDGGDEYDEARNTKVLDEFTRFLEGRGAGISDGSGGPHFYDSNDREKPSRWSVAQIVAALRQRGFGARYQDPKRDTGEKCAEPGCGHAYERHFDWMEHNREVGCKYCPCGHFKEIPF